MSGKNQFFFIFSSGILHYLFYFSFLLPLILFGRLGGRGDVFFESVQLHRGIRPSLPCVRNYIQSTVFPLRNQGICLVLW